MGQFFGTDGVRGIANLDLTNELAYELGRYGAYVLTKHLEGDKATVLVGKDTRLSSDMLESALIAGMLSVGCDVVRIGVVPTPAIAFLVKNQGFDAGVMISASHNSFEYNGIKFFNHEGFKLSDAIEDEIEEYLTKERTIDQAFTHDKLGRFSHHEELVELYLENAKQALKRDLSGLKLALDCAHGATTHFAKQAFTDLGADVTVMGDEPDGVNINDNCGSTHLTRLKEMVRSGDFDFGLAFDGDGDRVLAVDSEGFEVDGDKIMAICAEQMREDGTLKNDTIVATVMSNLGFTNYAKEQNLKVLMSKVGDRYVLEDMLAGGHTLGGEQSGHIIFLGLNQTGDGILTGLKLAEAVLNKGERLRDMAQRIPRYPQVIVNARINKDRKHEYLANEEINEAIRQAEETLHGKGRVLIRPSGTEPLVRVMLEGEDETHLKEIAENIAKMYERVLA